MRKCPYPLHCGHPDVPRVKVTPRGKSTGNWTICELQPLVSYTHLHEGDYIQAVGSEESLNQLAVLVGEREEGELPLVNVVDLKLFETTNSSTCLLYTSRCV